MQDWLIDRAIIADLEGKLGRDAVMRVMAAQVNYGRQILGQLDALAVAPDAETLRRLAHQMAGSSTSVGLVLLGQAAVRVEQALLRGETDRLAEQAAELRDLMRASVAQVVDLFPDIL